ncbi:MAG: polysaccharide deacetylase family protein [Aeromicrobium sp.]
MSTIRRSRRRILATQVIFFLTLLVAAVLAALPSQPTSAAVGPRTVVSLTFDDANANQRTAATILDKYNLDGTFFVPSGFVGAPGYLTLADLNAFKAAGHEIGGHTTSHPDLTTLPSDEVKRQICNDRAWLSQQGFAVRSFAYPYASVNASVKAMVSTCGYNSARGLGDVRSPASCRNCVLAETLPPADAFETRAPDQVETNWTLRNMQDIVTRAETRGGWIQLTFHNICASGCDINVTPAVLEQFVSWLKARTADPLRNTVVLPVGDAVGGAVKPVVTGSTTTPIGPGVNGVVNPSMENRDADGTPTCWMKGGYGSNTANLTVVSPGRTGQRAGRVAVSAYVDGDAKWLPRFDLGGCSPTIAPGHTYSLRSWYTSTAVTQFAVYLRDDNGAWHYWTSSPWFASATAWTQATWTTPAIPAGMTGISFGLSLFNNGTLTVDDAAIYDTDGAPAAATASVAAATPSAAPRVDRAIEPQVPTGVQD